MTGMGYLIHAPAMGRSTMEATAAFRAVIWLAMQAPKVKKLARRQLNQLVLQPQAAGCEVLVSSEDGQGTWKPRLCRSYANLSAVFERQYVRDPYMPLLPKAWHSGDRLWLIHPIVPNSFAATLRRTIQDLFSERSARSLSPRSRWSGQKLLIWRGTGCSRVNAMEFRRQRPRMA